MSGDCDVTEYTIDHCLGFVVVLGQGRVARVRLASTLPSAMTELLSIARLFFFSDRLEERRVFTPQ